MINHSAEPIIVHIHDTDVQLAPLRLRDFARLVEWANARATRQAIEALQPSTVAEQIEIYRQTRNTYTIDRVDELLTDVAAILELIWICYSRANEGADRDTFDGLFGVMDIPTLSEVLNAISGLPADDSPTRGREAGQAESAEESARS
jgi:hypothetical protein